MRAGADLKGGLRGFPQGHRSFGNTEAVNIDGVFGLLLRIVSAPCLVLAGLNAFQAITGRRLSKAPSRRDDHTMRRQSAVAAGVLGIVGLLAVALSFAIPFVS